jgi:hypothetical protein
MVENLIYLVLLKTQKKLPTGDSGEFRFNKCNYYASGIVAGTGTGTNGIGIVCSLL